MPFTFLSPDEFLCNNSKNHLYTSAQVRLLYLMLDVREIGPRTSWSNRDAIPPKKIYQITPPKMLTPMGFGTWSDLFNL